MSSLAPRRSPWFAIAARRPLAASVALVAILVAAIVSLSSLGTPNRVSAGSSYVTYDDALAPGWSSCSWDAAVDFASTAQVYAGSKAIALSVAAPGGGLCVRTSQAIDTTPFANLTFAARAAQNGGAYQVFLYDQHMQPLGYKWLAAAGGNPSTSGWVAYTISLLDLQATARQVGGLGIQLIGGTTPQTVYLDQIVLTAPPVPASPTPSPSPAPTASAISSPSPAPTAPGTLGIFTDALAGGWTNCSWDAGVDFAAPAPVHGGSRSIALTTTAAGGGLCLTVTNPIDTSPYATLSFAARAAQSGGAYKVFLYDRNMQPLLFLSLANAGGDPAAGGWTVYSLPLAALGAAKQQIRGLAVQLAGGGIPATLYVDDVALVKGSVPTPTPASTIALGAYVYGAPGNPAPIDAFSTATGKAPAIVMWYQDWGSTGSQSFDAAAMNAVVARGAMPMVTWQPWGPPYVPNAEPAWALARITAGDYDAYVHQWAHAAATWGKPLYLRFAHEMNGYWNTWSPGMNGNTAADYVAAWRHVHDIFSQESAANVRWVWSPNVFSAGDLSVLSLYPGDAYVDWLGLDGYNWGTAASGKSWQSLASLFGYSYDVLTSVIAKPIMIAETASTELGGDKAAWITHGLLTDLQARLPGVRAVIWFDENKETDWRVESSTTALAAFRQVAASPAFTGTLP